jgi:signal transduction histidine kinase
LNGAPQLARKRVGREQAAHDHAAHEHEHADLTLPCVVHDLNNVYQALLSAADALSEDPQWQGVSAAILRSVERCQEITASLVTAAQPPAELAVVVENAIALAKDSMIAGRGPAMKFVSEVEPGLVLPQAWAWERVLMNLLLNAVHAMPQGGTATVRARQADGRIEIVVTDEGTGIAPELLAAIFEPHVTTRAAQQTEGRSASEQGRGLRLHIVHTIVTGQRGQVRVTNRPEGGAEFTITIPDASLYETTYKTAQEAALVRSAGA